jgi:Flp pilus assembly protein TadG
MNIRNSGRQPGQTLIEFAIILPVLLLIVMVVFDLGRIVYYYSMLTNAAREGARYGSTNAAATNTIIQQRVLEYAAGFDLQPSDVVVNKSSVTNVEVEQNSIYRDDINVEVTIDFDFVPITPYVDRLLPGGALDIQISSRMGREYK